jgi:nucleoside 2-deoxyribosyltransferase
MKVYLAVPIMANRQLEKAKAMAQLTKDLGYELISSWVIKKDPGSVLPAQTVFERDLNGVKGCDILLAEVSNGSHGVGMEIMAAYLYGKSIILLHEKGARVSRMLQEVPNALLASYDSLEELLTRTKSTLQELSLTLTHKQQ